MTDKLLTVLSALIAALNNVSTQVWSIAILLIGASLVVAKHADMAQLLIGGGLAIFTHKQS